MEINCLPGTKLPLEQPRSVKSQNPFSPVQRAKQHLTSLGSLGHAPEINTPLFCVHVAV